MYMALLFIFMYCIVPASCHSDSDDDRLTQLETRIQQLESMHHDFTTLQSAAQSYETTIHELKLKVSKLKEKLEQVEENGKKGLNTLKNDLSSDLETKTSENKAELMEKLQEGCQKCTKIQHQKWKENEVKLKVMEEEINKIQGNLSSFQAWQTQYDGWRNSKFEIETKNFVQKISSMETHDSVEQERVDTIEKQLPDLKTNLDSTLTWIKDHEKTWKELDVGQRLDSIENKFAKHTESLGNMVKWKEEMSSQLEKDRSGVEKIISDIEGIDVKMDNVTKWRENVDLWREGELNSKMKNHDSMISSVGKEFGEVTEWKGNISNWRDETSSKLTSLESKISTLDNKATNMSHWKEQVGLWQNKVEGRMSDLDSWKEKDVVVFIQESKGKIKALETESSNINILINDWKGEITVWRMKTDAHIEGFSSWRADIDNWKNTEMTRTLSDHNTRVLRLEDSGKELTTWRGRTDSHVEDFSFWRAGIDNWKSTELTIALTEFKTRVLRLENDGEELTNWRGRADAWRAEIDNWKNTEMTRTLSDHNTRVLRLEDSGKELKTWRENMSSWRSEEIDKEWQNSLTGIEKLKGKVQWLEISGGDTSFLLYLMVLIIVAMVGLLVLILMRTRSLGKAQLQQYGSGSTNPTVQLSFLDSIHAVVEEDSICVVSFHSNTQSHHKQLTEKITKSLGKIPVHTFLVHGHDNIPKMHLSRLFIVYVDHNERNIILEDPDQELGDLRRTTVQAAIKMGATVFVVYTHDRGSENLKEGQLYNERLASITKHTVLSPLNEKHRVLSINKDFMAHQRTHLQKEICNVLDKKNK